MKWITFFSQTGSEIVELSKALGRAPDLIVTNNQEKTISYHPGIRELGVPIQIAKHDALMNYFRSQLLWDATDSLVTLHGYLRIIPEDICNRYTLFNGHPGLISKFPELKGKDPQVRTWEGDYPYVGSVVHKVTPGVDEGEIVSAVSYTNRCESLEELFGLLKRTSLESWLWYLKEQL